MEVVQKRNKEHLEATPLGRLAMTYKEEPEEKATEYAKVRTVVAEMLLKALPKDLAAEAITKRLEDQMKILLFVMIKYQPGGRREQEALHNQITHPEVCWTEEQALEAIRTWKRRIERAKELKLIIPDPSIMLTALDTIAEKVLKKDQRRTFRMENIRDEIKVDILPTYEAVEQLTKVIEAELEEAVNVTTTTNSPPKVKTMQAKGDKEKTVEKVKATERENPRMIPKDKARKRLIHVSTSTAKKDADLVRRAKVITGC